MANPLPGTSGKSIQISTLATETSRPLSTTYISGGATTYYISFAFNAAPFQGFNAGAYAGVSVFLASDRNNNLLGGMPGSSGALGFDWANYGAPDQAASNNTNYLILLKIAPGTSSGNTSVTMYVTTNLWMSGATLAAKTPWAYPLDDPANFSFDSVGIAGSYGTGTINLAGLAMADNATEAVSFTRTALNLLPTATTSAASSITTTGATLGGTVNDNGATTAVSFDYGLTTSYGTNTAATPGSIAAGTGSTSVTATLTGLTCSTTYHFRVKAVNSAGINYGSDQSFTTSICSQTITFTNPGSQNFGTTPTLTATASSGLTPSFTSSTTGVCTITSGGSLTFVTTGTCTINADQAGNSSYSAATQVSQSFTVNAVVPTLQVTNSPQTYTGSAIAATVTCSSGGAVSNIQCNGSSTVPTNAGTYAITANCAATGSYSALTNASAGNLIIATAAPTVSVTNSPQTYTGSAIAATVTCSSGGAVSNIQYNGSSTVPTNAGTYAITANCAATGNYSALTDATAGDFAINPAGDTPGGIVTASITGGGFVPGTANFTPPVNPPAGQTFPYEMFGFTATTPVGGSITITLTYPQPLAADTRVWKELNGAWLDWTSQVTLSGSTITYSITDGGAGDADGAVNGSITDPLGPSSPSPVPNPIPMLSEWVQTLMIFLMIAAAGFYGGRMKMY